MSLSPGAKLGPYEIVAPLGADTFSHESSGVHANSKRQVWTTSSFLGSAIVTAYHAERCSTPGLRIMIHPLVMRRNTEPYLKAYAIPLTVEECTEASSNELRFWRSGEAEDAAIKLKAFRDNQDLSERAARHYNAALMAYEKFGSENNDLPFITPAIWLQRSRITLECIELARTTIRYLDADGCLSLAAMKTLPTVTPN